MQEETIAAEPQTERVHYRFDGWFTDAAFSGERVTFPFAVTQDATLYAKWTQTEFSVTFEENGGEAVTGGWFGKIEAEPRTERSGFIFGGWFTSPSFTGESITFPYTLTQSITLYAKWTPQPQLLALEGFTLDGLTANANSVYPENDATLDIADAVTVSEGAAWAVFADETCNTPLNAAALTLESGTVGIADGVFKDNGNLTSVDCGSSLKYIGKYAFGSEYGMSVCQLTAIELPASLRSIDASAFRYQKSLSSVKLNDGLEFIGEGAFDYCDAAGDIVVPVSVKVIQKDALSISKNGRLFLAGNLSDIRAESEWNGWGGIRTPVYEYSETPKTGNYWRYVDGVPTVWETA